ncbi:hypothetical protein SRABI106_01838 [Rahnella aquatilis]|nr:hypothetical protein SRABI106_01838 [Rahnella aquatilis]
MAVVVKNWLIFRVVVIQATCEFCVEKEVFR